MNQSDEPKHCPCPCHSTDPEERKKALCHVRCIECGEVVRIVQEPTVGDDLRRSKH